MLLIICFWFIFIFFKTAKEWSKVRLSTTVGYAMIWTSQTSKRGRNGDGEEIEGKEREKLVTCETGGMKAGPKGGKDGRLYTAGVLGAVAHFLLGYR